jgi:hypothetical protein
MLKPRVLRSALCELVGNSSSSSSSSRTADANNYDYSSNNDDDDYSEIAQIAQFALYVHK